MSRFPACRLRSLAVLALCGLLAPYASAASFSTVVLDPGHGGSDKGSNWSGVLEKTLTLDLAKRVRTILRSKGVNAVLTRTTDKFVALEDRAAYSNRYSNAIFVSIHFNGHLNRGITGIETFYYSRSGRRLASSIQKGLMGRIRTRDRGIKRRGYKVLLKTKATAALVECGFLSNSWERKRCNEPWFRQILAEQIAVGIMAY
ncbi:MAG: N-acetylmuramoyl-L-alanine amidase [Verrucomicrobiales bacterium]